jgi:anti-anti-sigma factor
VHDSRVIALSTSTIRVVSRDGVPVVEVSGEIDLVSGGPLLAVLSEQLDRRPAELVVDLNGVDFFGSTGIRVLVDADARARDLGAVLVVAANTRAVLRPLVVTGTDGELTIRPTVDVALAEIRTGRSSSVA